MQRAVGLTSKMAERGGLLVKVERLLEQTNLPLRPAEALFFYAAGVTLIGILAMTGAPSLIVGQPDAPPLQLLPEDAVLLHEVLDDLLLVAVDPSSEGHEQ